MTIPSRRRPLASLGCLAALVLAVLVLATPAVLAAAPVAPAGHATARVQGSGVYYEIFVRSFYDSNGDGIGDLNGITEKLDYLKSLGISGIWLTPINPSPSYHGYDITNYKAINPQFGTMADFRRLLRQAHTRHIKVLMDLVANHTSNRHPWFVKALNPGSRYHDWYTWAGKGANLKRMSATGGPAWHKRGTQYYLGTFTAGMPDLNYDNPAVRKAMIGIGRFWLRRGVDGFRLDAARHIYENFEGQDHDPPEVRENLAWWKQFRAALEKTNPHVFLVGEVSADSEGQLTPYYAGLDSVFNFPIAKDLVEAARTENSTHIGSTLHAALARFDAAADGQPHMDTPFLSNHDQDRVMSQLHGNMDHMRMAAAMLLTLPGRPFLYYGEEIGMTGSKPDPRIREPMRWDRSTTAPGETTWEPLTFNTHPAVSVAAEQHDPGSLLNFYRTLLRWRQQLPALRDGSIAGYPADGGPIAVWIRRDAAQTLLVVHNLSAKPSHVILEAGAPHVSSVLRSTRPGAVLRGRNLSVPAYTTVILQ